MPEQFIKSIVVIIIEKINERIKKVFIRSPIRIEIFSNKKFQQPRGMQTYVEGKWHPERRGELVDNDQFTSVIVTNVGEKSVSLDQIAFAIYHKKSFFNRRTTINLSRVEKYTRQLPSKISPGDYSGWIISTNLTELPKGKIIYEVIAFINNRKIKHVHKVCS